MRYSHAETFKAPGAYMSELATLEIARIEER